MIAVEVRGLRKTYRGGFRGQPRRALDGLDLTVPQGEVHGFLGPNGSGKTTTLRVLTGLVHADSGAVSVLGHSLPGGLADVVNSMSSVVESPRFFPPFSGRYNLGLLADVAGFDAKRVDEALETVGLIGRENDPVRAYSLGMRQRLGIAGALLKRPRLLLLDEPTNGLDPGGMREVRTLMRRLAEQGVTVLLSSHLLHEVEQVCSSVTIVARGRALRTGSVTEVLAGATGDGSAARRVRVTVEDPAAAAAVLTQAGLTAVAGNGHCMVGGAPPREVNRLLVAQGIWLDEITVDQAELEDVFISLTEDPSAQGTGVLAPVDRPVPGTPAGGAP
ncbi:MAG TPA: ABC transporter ATP-binding protein [Actinomycetota bacterium]|nr:ABC transporter ATP-binding protein [Actinomycetota bacterium]